MIDTALEAWFVNEPIRDWYTHEYPKNSAAFHVVANGFDPVFVGEETPDRARDEAPRTADTGLTFGYLGTIYGRVPLRETLEAWRLARQDSDVIARSRLVFRGRLGHYATPDARVAGLFDEFATDGVSYGGPVSKTQVRDVYRGFDALVFIAAPSRYVTSGKVFEYAATGLPIGAFHHPDTAATSVLRGRPGVFPVAETTPRRIADALIQMGDYIAHSSPDDQERARAWSAHLSRDAQIAPRIAALRTYLETAQAAS